jgi:hypothetical protein
MKTPHCGSDTAELQATVNARLLPVTTPGCSRTLLTAAAAVTVPQLLVALQLLLLQVLPGTDTASAAASRPACMHTRVQLQQPATFAPVVAATAAHSAAAGTLDAAPASWHIYSATAAVLLPVAR